MMMYSTLLSAIAAMLIVLSKEAAAASPPAIALGNCADFAIMGGTAVSFNGVTTAVSKGNVGVSPGTSISGSVTITSGYLEANSANAQGCAASMLTAYNAAKATTCQTTATPANLGGLTLKAGVYCNAGGSFVIISGKLTLSGTKNDVWIFQTATSVTTAASTSIVMAGGALAKNVFWQVGTTLQTGASSSFVGTVLSGTSITLGSDATLNGRALAKAAVSCTSGNTVVSFVNGAQ